MPHYAYAPIPGIAAADVSVRVAVLDPNAAYEHAVEGAVAGFEGRALPNLVSLRCASSWASYGRSGLSRSSASLSRYSRTTSS